MSVTQELLTVRDWLRYAVSRFVAGNIHFGHGTTNAYDEAAYIILHKLHLPIDTLEPFLEARLMQPERGALLEAIERRVNDRVPASYLTQQAWLGDLEFYVDERVIIPRSFIAELIPDALEPWISDPRSVKE